MISKNLNLKNFVLGLIDNKVDKVSGKGLSTEDYTTSEKTKLAGIANGANKITVDSIVSDTSTNPIQNKIIKEYVDESIDGITTNGGEINLQSYVKNSDLATVATTGSYNDLTNKPIIPVNTSDLTNDSGFLNTHQDISGKVDKVSGKGLSTEDYTTAEKTKLAGIETGANKITKTSQLTNDSGFLTSHQDITSKVDKTNGTSQITDTNANNYSNIGSLSSGANQQTINNAINTAIGNNVAVTSYKHTVSDLSGINIFDLNTSYIQFYKIGKIVIAYFRMKSDVNIDTSYTEFTYTGVGDGDVIPSAYRPIVETISHNFCHFNTEIPRILTTRVNSNGIVEMRGNTSTSVVNNYYTMMWITS